MAYAGPMPAYPLKNIQAITKSDVTTYDPPLTCVRIGDISGGAVLVAKNLDGTSITFAGCTAGELIWGPFTAIMSTSTTVASIVGWKNE
jgi:hypothetical protein